MHNASHFWMLTLHVLCKAKLFKQANLCFVPWLKRWTYRWQRLSERMPQVLKGRE